jgi:hypothetical protein
MASCCGASSACVLDQLLESYADQLADNFVVATETLVRFARPVRV